MSIKKYRYLCNITVVVDTQNNLDDYHYFKITVVERSAAISITFVNVLMKVLRCYHITNLFILFNNAF